MTLDVLPSYQALKDHAKFITKLHVKDLFEGDPKRFDRYSFQAPHVFYDYSKNRVTEETISLLSQLTAEAGLEAKVKALFCGTGENGDLLNNTEDRGVLHTALRLPKSSLTQTTSYSPSQDILDEILECRIQIQEFVDKIHQQEVLGYTGKPIDTLVSIGIGGSYLGPKTVTEALSPIAKEGLSCHYIANVDSSDSHQVLSQIVPESTIFLIQSKSFGTQETLTNAQTVKNFLLEHGMLQEDLGMHIYAVSSNIEAAIAFGVKEENIFPMWDWVGGRYSLWSAIGLPIAFMIGNEHFEALLQGAHEMDEHFISAPFEQNMPSLMAMLGIWYHSFFGADSHAVMPYDQYLSFLPDHLQQLDMESNGKHVSTKGKALTYHTGPIIWGGTGTNGQHAFHQLLHQGTKLIPCDFIATLDTHHPSGSHHKMLLANCLSQTQALMQGRSERQAFQELLNRGYDEPKAKLIAKHMEHKGNQPSNTFLIEKTLPKSVGALIAAYEHKVFVQGVIWELNSFDQWGVELGKKLGNEVLKQLEDADSNIAADSSTAGLIAEYHRFHENK
ncbi:glucose-6-phosphate isomerase [Oleiphilus sp. HI0085]|nr:glucose-6-phosphate isomerase [Oleiphilus sp. HI0069]KZZ31292.1 glucose-6-phosphate isomerase [Oleiphilus sp. HI0085]